MQRVEESQKRTTYELDNLAETTRHQEDTFMEEDALLETRNNHDDVTELATQNGLLDYVDLLQHVNRSVKYHSSLNSTSDDNQDDEVQASHDGAARKWSQPVQMYLIIVVTAFGAMGQGWSQTGINGANLYWPELFSLGADTSRNNLIVGIVNAAMYLSNGLIGAWLVAPLNTALGRRGATFVAALVSAMASILCGLTQDWVQLLLCRLLLGIGLAIISSTLNVYAAESAPAAIRGGLAVSWQMFCAFGIFTGFVANALVDARQGDNSLKWRIMISMPMLTNLPLLALLYICPESPSWHIKTSANYNAAFASLRRLRNTDHEAAQELLSFYVRQKRYSASSNPVSSYLKSLTEVYTIPRNRRAVLASYTAMLAQQLCGINIIAFYSSTIFRDANFSPFAASLASVVFGFINFLGAFPAIWTMDTLGRRSLLLLTLPAMAVSMAVAGFSFSITATTFRFGMITSMIYLFCLLYSPGMGPVPAAYSAEVFPLSHREIGTSSAIAATNLFAAVLSLTFPYLLSVLGTQGSFLLYAVLNIVAWFLVFLFVPETKRKTLDELDKVFEISTIRFIAYQRQHALWWIRRYITGDRKAMLPRWQHAPASSYTETEQDNADY